MKNIIMQVALISLLAGCVALPPLPVGVSCTVAVGNPIAKGSDCDAAKICR